MSTGDLPRRRRGPQRLARVAGLGAGVPALFDGLCRRGGRGPRGRARHLARNIHRAVGMAARRSSALCQRRAPNPLPGLGAAFEREAPLVAHGGAFHLEPPAQHKAPLRPTPGPKRLGAVTGLVAP